MIKCSSVFFLLAAFPLQCHSWMASTGSTFTSSRSSIAHGRPPQRCAVLQASSSDTASTTSLTIVPNSGKPEDLQRAAAFMVDAFWLGTPRQQILMDSTDSETANDISEAARTALVDHQFNDFTDKYGERMGQRLCESMLLEARDAESNELLGLVGLEITLMQQTIDAYALLSTSVSEKVLQSAVASLGPKQRRQYKSATAPEIAQTFLANESMQAVATLVNLAVAPTARRRGVAQALCQAVENVISQQQESTSDGTTNKEYTISQLVLQVEADNTPARTLYEDRFGYQLLATLPTSQALRANVATGEFEPVTVRSLLLQKTIGASE